MRFDQRFLFLLASGVVLAFCPSAPAQPSFSLPRIVPGNRFDFRDDHDKRRLADIRLKIVERGGLRALEMTISAVGPDVQPIPGYAGVPGANRHTAQQLDNILTGHSAFAVRTQANDAGASWFGTWREGRRGAIPERRIGADGRIDFFAVTPREYPLDLIVDTVGIVEGRQTTELFYDGVPRLRITYEVAGNQVRIVGFESVVRGPANPALLQAKEEGPEKEKPFKFPYTDKEWQARDLEGKWMLYRKALAEKRLGKPFVNELAKRQEFELLELIALNGAPFDVGIAAAQALTKADAKEWLRTVAWMRQINQGYAELEFETMLLKHHPAKALAWLNKHADEAILFPGEIDNPHVKNGGKALRADLLNLKLRKIKPGDVGNALPPHNPADVFRHLDAPKDLADFGDRERAEPGKVYVHQVLRAIDTFTLSDKFREPWIGKVRTLTKHPHLKVRQAALLAFTEFAQNLDAKDPAVDDFRKVIDDANEPAAIREAALMAFSHFDHPQVFVRLHEIALDPSHPGWRGALGIYSGGNEFTYEHLGRIDRSNLLVKDAEYLDSCRTSLRKALDDPQRRRDMSGWMTQAWIERAAWAEHVKSPLAKTLTPWTRSFFVNHPKLTGTLHELHNSYAPRHAVADPAGLARRVRTMIVEILASRKEEN